ncbi:MAG: hypothetical protein CL535_22585 [Ahrensia sp.]|nr:hypothetical protein [Ahrensia sp.]|tara:strand:- start:316 stop:774 length:459 start_codon:yes stop_codon:yes gene_type:complete
MTKFAAFASAVGAAALLYAAPAAADYTIDEDPAFPSVVYINFDVSTMPKVIMAPAGDQMSVIHGGAMEIQNDVAVQPDQTDPNSPDLQKTDTAAKKNTDQTDDEQTASTTPLEKSVDQRVNDILGNQQKMEDIMIDADIENRLQEEADRLLN